MSTRGEGDSCRRRVARGALGIALAAALSSCAWLRDPDDGDYIPLMPVSEQIPAFSAMSPGRVLPPGWRDWVLHPSKKRTAYDFVDDGGGTVMRAYADASASGLIARVAVDPQAMPTLRWRWRVESLIEGADATDYAADDSPVRVVLAFDGDKTLLPADEQMFLERVKLLSGRELPYATLMYVWENRQPLETIVSNPHTSRVRQVVVSSGPAGVGRWQSFRRDFVADYLRAFGELPGRLVGVGVMTDTDNTKSRVTAYYGDIELGHR